MSNLGAYQWFTTISKKVGGPYQLLGITAIGGYTVIRIIEAGGKAVYKLVKKNKGKNQRKNIIETPEYTVIKAGKSNENVNFSIGDKFRILEKDKDSVLIDKLGDPNSPYFVSASFLEEISEYDGKSKARGK